MIFTSLNTGGLKSNFGSGVAGAEPLYLSNVYSLCNLASKNLMKLARFWPIPQLWHLKNISFLTL